MKNERGLGKGLSALIGSNNASNINTDTSNIIYLNLNSIVPNPNQPRYKFSQEAINELTESIRQKGVLQPLIVRLLSEDKYQIVAGERRWRASKEAGLKEVPVLIKNLSDKEVLEIAIIENIQRENLTPIEEAKSYQKLIQEFAYTQEELAKEMGVSRTHITNLLRVLTLPETILQMIEDNKISLGHAKLLVGHPQAYALAMQCHRDEWSVRFLEKVLKTGENITKPRQRGNNLKSEHFSNSHIVNEATREEINEIKILEESLQKKLQMKVEIQDSNNAGSLIIHYRTLEELDRLVKVLYFTKN